MISYRYYFYEKFESTSTIITRQIGISQNNVIQLKSYILIISDSLDYVTKSNSACVRCRMPAILTYRCPFLPNS